MAFNQNPLQWKTLKWQTSDPITQKFDPTLLDQISGQLTRFVGQVGDFCNAVITQLTQVSDPVFLSGLFNGGNLLLATALSNSLTDLGSPAGNSTVDTKQAAVIAVRVSWTTAANWTLTLNNVAQGSLIFLRLPNNSGAARTFTILANNPASVAYAVTIFIPAATILSAGTNVNNATAINGFGVAYTVGGTPMIHLIGSIG